MDGNDYHVAQKNVASTTNSRQLCCTYAVFCIILRQQIGTLIRLWLIRQSWPIRVSPSPEMSKLLQRKL